jgi:hypothetical protein
VNWERAIVGLEESGKTRREGRKKEGKKDERRKEGRTKEGGKDQGGTKEGGRRERKEKNEARRTNDQGEVHDSYCLNHYDRWRP